ncbi:unknown [Anaerotruncus sp. CAG:390]|nr:unknown [Anaerotruncus sp. CAG:390]
MSEKQKLFGRDGYCAQKEEKFVGGFRLGIYRKLKLRLGEQCAVTVGKQSAARPAAGEFAFVEPYEDRAFAVAGAQHIGGAYHHLIASGRDRAYFGGVERKSESGGKGRNVRLFVKDVAKAFKCVGGGIVKLAVLFGFPTASLGKIAHRKRAQRAANIERLEVFPYRPADARRVRGCIDGGEKCRQPVAQHRADCVGTREYVLAAFGDTRGVPVGVFVP